MKPTSYEEALKILQEFRDFVKTGRDSERTYNLLRANMLGAIATIVENDARTDADKVESIKNFLDAFKNIEL